MDYHGNKTHFSKRMYCCDSLLLKLTPIKTTPTGKTFRQHKIEKPARQVFPVYGPLLYTIHEPNALLLDMAEFAIDDEEYQPCEEILRADNICRQQLGYPLRQSAVSQPWTRKVENPEHILRLRFAIPCAADNIRPLLGAENAENLIIRLNGSVVTNNIVGYYVDKCIKTIPLPVLKRGMNQLEIIMPFGCNTSTEWFYLARNFGVCMNGREKSVIAMPHSIQYGDIVDQGFPFYSGKLTYHLEIKIDKSLLDVTVPEFCGTLVRVAIDGVDLGIVAFPPYRISLSEIPPGVHNMDITLYVPRTNGFGPVHNTKTAGCYLTPGSWRTQGDEWSYDYRLTRQGILAPVEIGILD